MPPPPPTLGVVVPVHDRARLVLDTLDSVAAQTRPVDALVVVDDGSEDDTREVVSAWMSAHPEVPGRLLALPHGGASRARNAGLEAVTDLDLVSFLDSDDLWPRDFADRAARALGADADLVAVSADRLFWNLDTDEKKPRSSADLATDPILFIVRRGAGIGSCTVLRRDVAVRCGGYPEAVPTGHDTFLFGRAAAMGRWGYLPGEPVIFKREHANRGGHADHIHRGQEQPLRRWAEATESLLDELGPDQLHRPPVRHAMARRWLQAARGARAAGRRDDALDHLKRARQWQPSSPRLLVESLKTWLTR